MGKDFGGALALALMLATGGSAEDPKGVPKPLTSEQKEKIQAAEKSSKESSDLEQAGKFKEAIAAAEKMLALEREVYGKTHEDVAGSLGRIGRMRMHLECWAGARVAQRECLEIRTALYGKDHWRVTDALLALIDVDLFEKMTADGRITAAKATRFHAAGLRFYNLGKYAEAEPVYKEALAGRRNALGDAHPSTLESVNNLAVLYRTQGRSAEAEPLHKEALAGQRKALGDTHPSTLTSINNLAALYHDQRRYADAEPFQKEALAGRRNALGNAHPSTLQSVSNLAEMYREQGRSAEAEPLHKEALAGRRNALGNAHPSTLESVNNLAVLYRDQGRSAEAEPLFNEALTGYRKALGDAHPSTLRSVNNLAWFYRDRGRASEAEPLYKEALAGTRTLLDQTAVGQAEGHQLAFRAMLRHRLDSFLSFGVAARTPAADRYTEVLAWKGAAFARRSQLRAAVEKSADPELTKLFAEASDVARLLANLASTTPPANQLDHPG